jgi:hypothetical protein
MERPQGGPVAHTYTRDARCKGGPHAVLLQRDVHGAGALVQQSESRALVQQAGKTQPLLLTTAARGKVCKWVCKSCVCAGMGWVGEVGWMARR